MTAKEDVMIVEVPAKERAGLEWILEESFEGWYLLHSKRTLRDIEVVRVAMSSGKPVGLVMLKTLEGRTGYVYYIAVAKAHRKKGIAKLLLEDALRRFKASRMQEVFASVEKNNNPLKRCSPQKDSHQPASAKCPRDMGIFTLSTCTEKIGRAHV